MGATATAVGVYQLDNGLWAYRFIVKVNGKSKTQRRTKDEAGRPFRTANQAARARQQAIERTKREAAALSGPARERKTVKEIYKEYCEKGRSGKAFGTIRKQDSLWENHLAAKYGGRYIDEITPADIQDYLGTLYYVEGRAYSYVESFLKMFYLIYGQAYNRDYIDDALYKKMCLNKETKIRMPKMKTDEDTDIVAFTPAEMATLDEYFAGTNAETAYMLGKYCGLRINECYGLKWSNVDLQKGTLTIDRQMTYLEGLIRLIPLKTHHSRRTIYLCSKMKAYLRAAAEQRQEDEVRFAALRRQNQRIITDIDGSLLSSVELVNCLPDGKIQTVNSMKFHSRTLQERGLLFKYHYLRHTYATTLALANTPEHLLCNQMGHSKLETTHRYYIAINERGVGELLKTLEML